MIPSEAIQPPMKLIEQSRMDLIRDRKTWVNS